MSDLDSSKDNAPQGVGISHSKPVFTIIIPSFQSAHTLREVLESIYNLTQISLLKEVVILDSGSTDRGAQIVQEEIQSGRSPIPLQLGPRLGTGLAEKYNQGLEICSTPLIIFLHADIVIEDKEALIKMKSAMDAHATLVASYATLLHPLELWASYGFWGRCLFARFVGKEIRNLTGKCDVFRKDLFLKRIGPFDEKTYRTAGEDGDIKARIVRAGLETIPHEVRVSHIHARDPHFSLEQLVFKHAQLAEAQGVLFRKYGVNSAKNFAMVFFREILLLASLLGLILPSLAPLVWLLIFIYCFAYTARVTVRGIADWFSSGMKTRFDMRLIALPFINYMLLYVSSFYSVVGYLRGRQTL